MVLSDQQNIDLLLVLVKLLVALGAIAIALLLLFWLRLKKLEKRIYLGRKQLKSRFGQRAPQISRKAIPSRAQPNSRLTQVYSQTPHRNLLRKSPRRSANFRWRWLFAIAIACITGVAIAIFQLSNNFISPELMPLIWLLIGITLFVGATFARE